VLQESVTRHRVWCNASQDVSDETGYVRRSARSTIGLGVPERPKATTKLINLQRVACNWRLGRSGYFRGQNNYVTTSPLSAPFAAYEVAVATEAASKAKSLVIVTGSDLRAAFPATMIVRSCHSSGLVSVRASPGQTTSNEQGRSDRRQRVA
jgi:hypothetical protein